MHMPHINMPSTPHCTDLHMGMLRQTWIFQQMFIHALKGYHSVLTILPCIKWNALYAYWSLINLCSYIVTWFSLHAVGVCWDSSCHYFQCWRLQCVHHCVWADLFREDLHNDGSPRLHRSEPQITEGAVQCVCTTGEYRVHNASKWACWVHANSP